MSNSEKKQSKSDNGPIHGFPLDEGDKSTKKNSLSNAINTLEQEADLTKEDDVNRNEKSTDKSL